LYFEGITTFSVHVILI